MSDVHVRMRLGGETYALAIEHVLEVVELGSLTGIPGSPGSVLGARNLNGSVLPVFDLARVLAIPGGMPQRVVVTDLDGCRAGLAVDEVTEVGPLPATGDPADVPYLTRSVLEAGEAVGVVDVRYLYESLGHGSRARPRAL